MKQYSLKGTACIAILVLASCQSSLTTYESDRITKDDAEKLFREWVFDKVPDMNPEAKFRLEEITTDEIWQRLHIQLFRLPFDHFRGPQVLSFGNGRIESLGCTFGGQGITHLLVTDLDSNGEAELVFSDSCGSGMQRSHIAIYLPENYAETQIYTDLTLFMGEFILEKLDDQTVIVNAGNYDYQKKRFTSNASIGILKFTKQNGQPELLVELEDNIPSDILKNLSTTVK